MNASATAMSHSAYRWLLSGIACIAAASALQPVLAQPSQQPLITREGSLGKPNIMLTLDSSWSMIYPYMPEKVAKVGAYTVWMPNDKSTIMHPSDNRYSSDLHDGAVLSDPTDNSNLYQRWMRSPDVNSIYYNPKVRYQPWLSSVDLATGVKTRYANANPAKVWLDPNKTSSSDLWVNLTDTSKASGGSNSNKIRTTWCTSINSSGSTSCSWVYKNFTPGLYFILTPGTDPNTASNFTKYDINNPPAGGFPKYPNRTDCVADPSYCTQAEERVNFANWFQYYRTRLHLTQASIPEAFLPSQDRFRLGWGAIHKGTTSIDGVNTSIVMQGVRDFTETHKADMVNWIRNIKSDNTVTSSTSGMKLNSGTPLRSAMYGVGQYFERSDVRSPWASNPGVSGGGGPASEHLACRRSYNLLVTDGYYNDTWQFSGSTDNKDNTDGPVIADSPYSYSYQYIASANANKLYRDGHSNTLADLGMYYWYRDLRDDLPNQVPRSDENPAFWQHLVQFTVGLGVTGNLTEDDFDDIISGSKAWWGDGSAPTTGDPRKIDDLLHAAVNSRGSYFSAKDSSELATAISGALGKTEERELKEAGVATAGLILENGNRKYVPSYKSVSWSGTVEAYSLDENGVAGATPLWNAETQVNPANHASRNWVTWDRAAHEAVPFTWTGMGTANQSRMGSAGSSDLVDYIRGDTSKSGTGHPYRARSKDLPDFVNSTPTLVKGNVDLGYEALPSIGATYDAFVDAKKTRNAVLFIGGNGGALHAFSDTDGSEVFGYVPRAVLPNLWKLAEKDYGSSTNYHQYYVDGPITESDAYISVDRSASGAKDWRNVLVGTLGAGGKGIYALNVTDLTNLGASSVLWEVTEEDAADLGYVTADVAVGVLPGGKWKVFLGNGAYSTAGKAVLYVIDLETGAVDGIEVGTVGGNGLGGVRLLKNSQQEVVAAFAGDLKGNLWRFEFTGSASSDWSVGFGGNPLFTAQDASAAAQPITATPGVIPHPDKGNIVIFATGKLMDESDRDSTAVQSAYGVWDETETGDSSLPADVVSGRTQLVQQTITATPFEEGGGVFYETSGNAVDWDEKKGWYMDFDHDAGNRAIYPVQTITTSFGKTFVLVSTVTPSAEAEDCSASSGRGYNFILEATAGAQHSLPIYDTNGDGVVNYLDKALSGYSTQGDGRDSILRGRTREYDTDDDDNPFPDSRTACENFSLQNTAGHVMTDLCDRVEDEEPTPSVILDRTWKRLLNPPRPSAAPAP